MPTAAKNSRSGLSHRSALSGVGYYGVIAAILFLIAGTGWRRGWLFFAAFLVSMVLSSAYLSRTNPEIFVARGKVGRGTKAWDKVLVTLILAAYLAIFLVAALDARYGWSSVSNLMVAFGYVLFTSWYVLLTWSYSVNPYAEPSVRIQTDRGQKVIDRGPYAIVRHPLYFAGGFLVAGMPLALGSFWALVPVAFGTVVIIVRTALEDRALQNELEGYRDYATRVRYRLIPGIW